MTAPAATPTMATAHVRKNAAQTRTIERVEAPVAQMLGKIHVIGAHGAFVLVETPSALVAASVPVGCVLQCRPPGVKGGLPTAELRVSPERRPPFIVADVLSGTPTVGDAAYVSMESSPSPAPQAAASAEPPTAAPPAAEAPPAETPAPSP